MSKILLVDDDADMIRLCERWLLKAGYEVETAGSGAQALDLASKKAYDLIVLDYAMPEMDGPAVLEALRANDAAKDIPVLFRTGKDDDESADVMERLHPAGVVSKAEGKPKLLKAISGII